MLKKILPAYIFNILAEYCFDELEEIHLRLSAPIIIVRNSKKEIVKNNAISYTVTKEILENIVYKSSDYSIYSIQNQIQNGYITLKNGIRIGISGEFSYDNRNIKNIQGLNIRIPHQIKNCSEKIFHKLFYNNDFLNTIIISPPGAGKTTLLRDILYQFNKMNEIYNISLIDDRNEIATLINGCPTLEIYKYCDIIANLDKFEGILLAVKNLNPDIIVTDEITNEQDCISIEKVVNNGVKILTTIHAGNIDDYLNKPSTKNLVANKIFDRYIILSKLNHSGEIVQILDKDFKEI